MVLENKLQQCRYEFSEVSLDNFENGVESVVSHRETVQELPPFDIQPTSISDIEHLYGFYKHKDRSSRANSSSGSSGNASTTKKSRRSANLVDNHPLTSESILITEHQRKTVNYKQKRRSKSCSFSIENRTNTLYHDPMHKSGCQSFSVLTSNDSDLSESMIKTDISRHSNEMDHTFENWMNHQNGDSDSIFFEFPSERKKNLQNPQNRRQLLSRRASLERLLHELYRSNHSRRQSSVYESDTPSENLLLCRKDSLSPTKYKSTLKCRKHLLWMKDIDELRLMHKSLSSLLVSFSSILVKELKKKDKILQKNYKQKDVVTAILHALSSKTRKDTRMRFSVEPFAGDSGFTQWHDAMKMCARLPGGIPQEFRRRMWLTLAEQHVRRRNMHWKEVERICFNEWASPDDEGLGDQIVKDLHRTGCSLFCGEEGEVNQVLLKRVLLAYARWNKLVGYCQGFNMLAAIILEVMDKQESDSLKVMIYLIEGVLPESYFANNLRGLSVDMAVFRELLRIHLPTLSRHLETLQQEAADQATGACYEPPLTNVFTMQWFLTLFSNCLPRDVVMRVWDLTFLHGNEMLLRTALAIWGRFANRIMEVPTADEFYCVMGNLTREMLTYGLMDANQLVQTLIGMAPFPFPGLAALRDKYTYNITPWTMTSVARKGLKIFYLDDDDDDEEKVDHDDVNHTMAVATAFGLAGILRKTSGHLAPSTGQNAQDGRNSPVQGPLSMRPNLDISALKKQYARLRERQRQAHVILTASNIRRKSMDEINKIPSLQKTNQITMKHLLRGKKALTTRTKRVVPQGVIPNVMNKKKVDRKFSDGSVSKNRNSKQSKSAVNNLGRPNSSKPKKDEPALITPISPVAIAHQQLMSKRSLPEEDQISTIEGENLPAVTIHWKDTPRRVKRRASLPYGVKLMEGGTVTPNLPDIKDDPADDDDDDSGSSTSTELCDEDLLADLSEEEILVEVDNLQRPLSTSPRLENHVDNGNSEERLNELLKEKPPLLNQLSIHSEKEMASVNVLPKLEPCLPTIDTQIVESKEVPPSNENIQNSTDSLLSEENQIIEKFKPPTNLEIPEITASLSLPEAIGDLSRKSLSSPTKWKWSFSEIDEIDAIQPVSPILKLHNFKSADSPEVQIKTMAPLTPQPEINIEKDNAIILNPENENQVQQRSNIFAYLFEITDVTKLSNVNSEEPSPIDDTTAKESPSLNDKVVFAEPKNRAEMLFNESGPSEEGNESTTLIKNTSSGNQRDLLLNDEVYSQSEASAMDTFSLLDKSIPTSQEKVNVPDEEISIFNATKSFACESNLSSNGVCIGNNISIPNQVIYNPNETITSATQLINSTQEGIPNFNLPIAGDLYPNQLITTHQNGISYSVKSITTGEIGVCDINQLISITEKINPFPNQSISPFEKNASSQSVTSESPVSPPHPLITSPETVISLPSQSTTIYDKVSFTAQSISSPEKRSLYSNQSASPEKENSGLYQSVTSPKKVIYFPVQSVTTPEKGVTYPNESSTLPEKISHSNQSINFPEKEFSYANLSFSSLDKGSSYINQSNISFPENVISFQNQSLTSHEKGVLYTKKPIASEKKSSYFNQSITSLDKDTSPEKNDICSNEASSFLENSLLLSIEQICLEKRASTSDENRVPNFSESISSQKEMVTLTDQPLLPCKEVDSVSIEHNHTPEEKNSENVSTLKEDVLNESTLRSSPENRVSFANQSTTTFEKTISSSGNQTSSKEKRVSFANKLTSPLKKVSFSDDSSSSDLSSKEKTCFLQNKYLSHIISNISELNNQVQVASAPSLCDVNDTTWPSSVYYGAAAGTPIFPSEEKENTNHTLFSPNRQNVDETLLIKEDEKNGKTVICQSSGSMFSTDIDQELSEIKSDKTEVPVKDKSGFENKHFPLESSIQKEQDFCSTLKYSAGLTLKETSCEKINVELNKETFSVEDNNIKENANSTIGEASNTRDISCMKDNVEPKAKIENGLSLDSSTQLENSDKTVSSVFVMDKKRDISSLSENNLSLEYFTKSGLGLEDFDTELPPLARNFKIHPSFKDTPKSKSWDNDVSLHFDFSKYKKIKSNLSDSLSADEITKDKSVNFENKEYRRCYFSKILKSFSLESELYEEIVNTSQNGLDLEEDSELIRRKLWAGVKSLSLDAELLIATNKDQKSCIDISTSSMPALDESPTDGYKESGQSYPHSGVGDSQSTLFKGFQKRRKGEAALKLMKENTKIIDKILNQRYGEWIENNSGINSNYEFRDETEARFLARKSSSDHSLSDFASNELTFPKSDPIKICSKLNNCLVNATSEHNIHSKAALHVKKDINILDPEKPNLPIDCGNSSMLICRESEPSSSKIEMETKETSNCFEMKLPHPCLISQECQSEVPVSPKLIKKSPLANEYSKFTSHDLNQSHVNLSEVSASESSQVTNSKYFSSVLNPESSDNIVISQTHLSCPSTTMDTLKNIPCDKRSASKPPTVLFSKLSKLSPKSSSQRLRADKSASGQIQCQKTLNSSEILEKAGADSKISPNSRQQIFNPFPTKPLDRPPKDLGVKLGLYNTTKSNIT